MSQEMEKEREEQLARRRERNRARHARLSSKQQLAIL